MKTAKEWAAGVVIGAECDGVNWAARIEDATASAWFETEPTIDDAYDDAVRASGVIERLAEAVQADARAPLVATLVKVRAALRHLQRNAVPGSTAEDICERMLPKIEEALR